MERRTVRKDLSTGPNDAFLAYVSSQGTHWAQSKGQFSSLDQNLTFEIWFSPFCHFIPTPWGPQISILRLQKQFGRISQRFELNIIGKRNTFDFGT